MSDGRIPSAGASLDSAAIAALFRDHHAELVRLALLMVGDLATAEDVVQDVYASLHRGSRARARQTSRPRCRTSAPPCSTAAVRSSAAAPSRTGLAWPTAPH